MEANFEKYCNCAKCHSWFNYDDAAIKENEIYGHKINRKCCPYCNNIGFTTVLHEKYLSKFLYTNEIN